MKPVECEFEAEVLAAALQSRWPDRVDAELKAHIQGCAICSDVLAIAGAIDDAREETRAEAHIPDSGRMWWLAQMRARREAARAAGRPITAVQVIAFGCAVALMGACFGATSTWFQSVLARIGMGVAAFRIQDAIAAITPLLVEHLALVLAAGALLVVVPAALCLAFLRD